jgi:hypothetical protein
VLAERGLAVAVDSARLSPKVLADAIGEVLTLRPPCVEIDYTGAETTARLVGEMCAAAGT